MDKWLSLMLSRPLFVRTGYWREKAFPLLLVKISPRGRRLPIDIFAWTAKVVLGEWFTQTLTYNISFLSSGSSKWHILIVPPSNKFLYQMMFKDFFYKLKIIKGLNSQICQNSDLVPTQYKARELIKLERYFKMIMMHVTRMKVKGVGVMRISRIGND